MIKYLLKWIFRPVIREEVEKEVFSYVATISKDIIAIEEKLEDLDSSLVSLAKDLYRGNAQTEKPAEE